MCDAIGKRFAQLIMKAVKSPSVRLDPVEELPEEILHLIWRLLDLKDLLSANLVSRRWHASLAGDNVWKRYTKTISVRSDKRSRDAGRNWSWKNKFLSQRSLSHNWSKNKFYASIKTPVTGQVGATEDQVVIWRDKSTVLMSPVNSVITSHHRSTDTVESVITTRDTDLVLIVTEDRRAKLFKSTGIDPVLTIDLNRFEKRMKLTSKFLCRCLANKLVVYDLTDSSIRPKDIGLPDCKTLNSYNILDTCILIRYEPLDFNYEAIYSMFDFKNDQWSIITKISTCQLGTRDHFESVRNDYFLLVNCLLVDDVFMYSNVYIYHRDKPLSREIVSNCRRKYFRAGFSQNVCLYTVADYRLSALDLTSLKSREIYINAELTSLKIVLDRFFLLIYNDRVEIWDLKNWKRLYHIKTPDKDRLIIRDEFVLMTTRQGTSLPPSLKVLNFTEPVFVESPASSRLDLSNVVI